MGTLAGGTTSGGTSTSATAKWTAPTSTLTVIQTTATADTPLALSLSVASGQVVRLHCDGIGAGGGSVTPYLFFSGVTLSAYDLIGRYVRGDSVENYFYGTRASSVTTGQSIMAGGTGNLPFASGVGLFSFDLHIAASSTGTLSATLGWSASTSDCLIYARRASIQLIS